MAEDLSEFSAGEFQTVSELLASSTDLQLLMFVLVMGLLSLAIAYHGFGKWMYSKKFSYTRPHVSRFVRAGMLGLLAIGLVTGVNITIWVFDVGLETGDILQGQEGATQTFAKILNTVNIPVSYTHLTLPTKA